MEIEANGGIIEYDVAGDGPPLVLMHGGETDRKMWTSVVPLFATNFTVLYYNQRDTGASKVSDEPYTMADLANDAASFIEALGYEKAHVLGSSYGGLIAQELAISHPDRVDRLILAVVSRGAIGGQLNLNSPEVKAVVDRALEGDPEANRKLNEFFFSEEALARDSSLPNLLPEIRYQRPPELSRRRMEAVYGYNSTGRLCEISAPTLVFAGGSDRIAPTEECWEITLEIPRATLVRLGGIGHVWSLEAPDRSVNLMTQFLLGAL